MTETVDITQKFTDYLHIKRLKATTIESYLRDLELLFSFVPQEALASVTDEQMREVVETLRGSRPEKSVRRWISVIEKFFDFCITVGLRDDSPMYSISIRSDPNCSPQVCANKLLAIPWEENFQGYRDAAIIALACYTYIRFTDFRLLTLKSFDMAQERINLSNQGSYPLPQVALQAVGKHVANMLLNEKATMDTAMFVSKAGTTLSRQAICKIVRCAMLQLGSIDENCNPNHLRGALVHHPHGAPQGNVSG